MEFIRNIHTFVNTTQNVQNNYLVLILICFVCSLKSYCQSAGSICILCEFSHRMRCRLPRAIFPSTFRSISPRVQRVLTGIESHTQQAPAAIHSKTAKRIELMEMQSFGTQVKTAISHIRNLLITGCMNKHQIKTALNDHNLKSNVKSYLFTAKPAACKCKY